MAHLTGSAFLVFTDIITNTVIIENMYVPELVESGSSDIILCCQFSSYDENYSVDWLFNDNNISSKEWNTYGIKISETQGTSKVKQSLLSLQRVTPKMSGNYTCQLKGAGARVQQTKHMFVFSPEKEFTLKIKYPNRHRTLEINCTAWGLYPRPEIDLEIDNKPVSNHMQRVWWKEDSYTAEGSASLPDISEGKHEVTCRLHLSQADYTAIVKKIIHVGSENMCCGSNSTVSINILILCATVFCSLIVRSDYFL